jgi:TRAP transporter 4TM/12TM fusion protein
MRKLGYNRSLAGAVEVAASTGGSLVPPVMGSAAFIMAEYTGIQYSEIVKAAVIPALLYYVCIYAQVHFRSLKIGLRGLDPATIPRLGQTLRTGGMFFVPLIVITVALLKGYTPTMVAVFGTLTVLAIAALRTATRLSLRDVIHVLAETCYRMVPVVGACAAAGLVIGGITLTGLAAKFAHVVWMITDASVFPALLLAASLTVVLGLGMPTPSAYILAAVLMGPLLAKLGVPLLGAHMFLLYYAVMSAVTPPVAVAAYAAASIAEANPLAIAGVAVRLALGAFIIPFGFVYDPALLMDGALLDVLQAMLTAAAGVIVLAIAVEGFWREPIPWWGRWPLAAAGITMILPWFLPALIGLLVTGAVLVRFKTHREMVPEIAPEG